MNAHRTDKWNRLCQNGVFKLQFLLCSSELLVLLHIGLEYSQQEELKNHFHFITEFYFLKDHSKFYILYIFRKQESKAVLQLPLRPMREKEYKGESISKLLRNI